MDHLRSVDTEQKNGLTTAHIHTDVPDLHSISAAVFQAFQTAGETLLELYIKRASLEDVFLKLTENEGVAETQKAAARKAGSAKEGPETAESKETGAETDAPEEKPESEVKKS